MTAGEVERMVVVLQEERFKVRKRVLFAEQTPDTVFVIRAVIVTLGFAAWLVQELDSLHFGELLNQGFINDEILVAVLSR